MSEDVVKVNECCFLKDLGSGRGSISRINEKGTVKVANKIAPIPVSLLIGLPFGSVLELRGKSWVVGSRLKQEDFVRAVLEEIDDGKVDEDDMAESPAYKKPRLNDLVDNNTAQTMAQEDVMALKAAGVDGLKLVSSLVTSSKTFTARTQFSREKYIIRKMKAHLVRIIVLKCDAVSIHDAYTSSKIGYLRPSDVYMMLNEANITKGSNVIVFDHTAGYLTLNVLRRLGGQGTCLSLSDKKGVSRHLVDESNMSEEYLEPLHMLPMRLLEKAIADDYATEDEIKADPWFQDCSLLETVINDPEKPAVHRERAGASLVKRRRRLVVRKALWEQMRRSEIDSFLVTIDPGRVEASAPHLVALLLSDLYRIALQVVKPGGRFICYSFHMHPLVDLAVHMKSRKNTWFNLRFEETMLRKICTLPGRSHPQMESSLRLFEGYMLTVSRLTGKEIDPTPIKVTEIDVPQETEAAPSELACIT
eukprot:Blabericola_migrator_1__3900@NODE_217_length_11276_cov_60_022660_g184_i0_p3_GENE_NODE_217_length_11276_cov_60_022660_g184_i0NODE_217_length_11276_cov_60_022660_g184_i0_p3_ORF_typecomplete_len476_score99_11Gcd10p/PF04189_13/1_6e50GCD14/PF08704_10/1_2GCD14/PF08704_10/7_NODE_217_length_11276_cov_60_022660_g184_i08362263